MARMKVEEDGLLGSPRWSALFFGVAIASAALGLGGLDEAAADVARALFFVFLLLAMVPIVRRAARETA